MAWLKTEVTVSGKNYLAMLKNEHCQVGLTVPIKDGDEVYINGMRYVVLSGEVLRDESLLLKIEVIENESTSRRNGSKSKRRKLPSKTDVGHDNSDRDEVGNEHRKGGTELIVHGSDNGSVE